MSAPSQAAVDEEEDQNVFNVEEIQRIVRDIVDSYLGGSQYSHSRCTQWMNVIGEKIIAKLNKLQRPFKYIVRLTITQKNGAGLHTAASYFWDTSTDGVCTVRWENKFMYCIVNVWGLALQ